MPIPAVPLPRAPEVAPAMRRSVADGAFVADWRDFVFVHYAISPAALQPQVPFALDHHDGQAFVSLVWFTLERMRTPVLPALGRCALRPLSDHPFLNVRTYVIHHGRPGICFLAEWIPNRLSLPLGPLTYGLPYRYGRFDTEMNQAAGVARLCLHDPTEPAELAITAPMPRKPGARCEPGSVDAFLLERYDAYTFRGTNRRRFAVAHPPWTARRADWIRLDPGLIESVFPWFRAASFHSAHLSPGLTGVQMGFPHGVD